MESTWESRDLVVLDAAAKFLDEHKGDLEPDGGDLVRLTGLTLDDVQRALQALDGVYLDVQMTMGEADSWFVQRVYPQGRVAVGQWPSPETVADRLVAELSAAADRAGTEEERGMLRKTAAWFGSAGRDLLVDVAAAVVTRGTGLSG